MNYVTYLVHFMSYLKSQLVISENLVPFDEIRDVKLFKSPLGSIMARDIFIPPK